MGVSVAFSYSAWVALFPEFASPGGTTPVTSDQAQLYFGLATGFFRNDGGGPVRSAEVQTRLLNLLVAHIAKIMVGPQGQAGLVGRISDASEGSVHVGVEMPSNMSAASAWFTQTQYGLMFWQLSAVYRTGFYLPNDRNPAQAGTGFGGWPGYLGGQSWTP